MWTEKIDSPLPGHAVPSCDDSRLLRTVSFEAKLGPQSQAELKIKKISLMRTDKGKETSNDLQVTCFSEEYAQALKQLFVAEKLPFFESSPNSFTLDANSKTFMLYVDMIEKFDDHFSQKKDRLIQEFNFLLIVEAVAQAPKTVLHSAPPPGSSKRDRDDLIDPPVKRPKPLQCVP